METLFTFSSWSVSLPLLVVIFRRGNRNQDQSILKWIVYAAVATEVISGILWYRRLNNLPLFHIYPLVELALLTLLYQNALRALYPRWLVPALSGCIFLFSIINSLFIQSIFTFNTYSITLISALFIVYPTSYFFFCSKARPWKGWKENLYSGSTVRYCSIFPAASSFICTAITCCHDRRMLRIFYGACMPCLTSLCTCCIP